MYNYELILDGNQGLKQEFINKTNVNSFVFYFQKAEKV